MVYSFRTPKDKISDDPAVWLREGIDRSGVLAVPFYFANILQQSTPERKALAALGPTASLGTSLFKIGEGFADGEVSEKDLGQLRRILPYQNLLWLALIEKAADRKVESLAGLPEGKKRKRKLRRSQ